MLTSPSDHHDGCRPVCWVGITNLAELAAQAVVRRMFRFLGFAGLVALGGRTWPVPGFALCSPEVAADPHAARQLLHDLFTSGRTIPTRQVSRRVWCWQQLKSRPSVVTCCVNNAWRYHELGAAILPGQGDRSYLAATAVAAAGRANATRRLAQAGHARCR